MTPARELQAFHCTVLKAPAHSSRKISNRQPRSSALAFTETGAQSWIGIVGWFLIVAAGIRGLATGRLCEYTLCPHEANMRPMRAPRGPIRRSPSLFGPRFCSLFHALFGAFSALV